MRIPVFRPMIESEEFEAARGALELGWLGMGSFVADFEQAIQNTIDATSRHIVAVSTGHAALHLGLLLAGVGSGDEVITPSFNNVADFQAILATGARPVFCDIDDRTLCIDVEKAAALITPRTRVIIAMDYDCHLSDHDAMAELSSTHGIRVLHDAAHSFGSKYKGRMIGSFSDICVFSFDPVKTITCIDGGVLVVRNEDDVLRLHAMRLIGMSQPAALMYQNQRAWHYDVEALGFRYHMANLHASIGLAQLRKIDRISLTRRAVCARYNAAFAGIQGLGIPETEFNDVTPFLYYIRVAPQVRNDLRTALSARGIDTGIHWQPGHWMSLFRGCRRGNLDVTENVGREVLSLPLHSDMNPDDTERVISAVRCFFKGLKV